MQINQILELSMVLETEQFQEVFQQAFSGVDYLEETDEGYIDQSFASKGITVFYRDSQYKKKIKLIVNSVLIADGDSDEEKFVRKLDKRITKYFNAQYSLEDFTFSGMRLSTDIDVGCRGNVYSYLKVLKRIGKIKGFSPASYDGLDDEVSFCLKGNSNATEFLIYSLKGVLGERFGSSLEARGLLRTEVRLTKAKAIRAYTDADSVSNQIAELSRNCQEIFFDTFTRVVPFGDFYKKDEAVEIIRREISDSAMRRKMLRLVALIPEKKSLHLAQKEMSCRNMDAVMMAFAKINLSPVTVSKRHDVKHLKNLYAYLVDEE